MSRIAAGVFLSCLVSLTACTGGATEADKAACAGAAEVPFMGSFGTEQMATSALARLSRLTPENDRLSRAIEQARDDAQTAISAEKYRDVGPALAAFDGSMAGVDDICGDLGAVESEVSEG